MGLLLRFKLEDFVTTYGLRTFIETGTARGESLAYAATRPDFTALLSCEIEPLMVAGAVARFNEDPRVKILRMESSLFMQMFCRSGLPPALFWLDAHYPGADVGLAGYADEADASLRLPLREELEQIARHRAGRDVILIDDLRIYEIGDWEDGPLPPDTPGNPTPGGADWMRALFAGTHRAVTVNRDQGYLMLLPLEA